MKETLFYPFKHRSYNFKITSSTAKEPSALSPGFSFAQFIKSLKKSILKPDKKCVKNILEQLNQKPD